MTGLLVTDFATAGGAIADNPIKPVRKTGDGGRQDDATAPEASSLR